MNESSVKPPVNGRFDCGDSLLHPIRNRKLITGIVAGEIQVEMLPIIDLSKISIDNEQVLTVAT